MIADDAADQHKKGIVTHRSFFTDFGSVISEES